MVDLDAVTALLCEAADEHVLPWFQWLEAHDIGTKSGPEDLVTAADLACEAFLTKQLGDILPEARIVGEEAVANDRTILETLDAPGYVWVIDPVDGTHNFAHGKAAFAIIVALVKDGALEAGWINVPLQRKTIVAARGAGAYCGEKRLHVAQPAPLDEMRAVLYVGAKRFPELYARVKEVRPQLGPRSFSRSAGMEYVHMAEGRVHYAMFTRELPWDHAAGSLIHREAGGYAAYLDGAPYAPVEETKPLLLAPDLETWRMLAALFEPG